MMFDSGISRWKFATQVDAKIPATVWRLAKSEGR